MKILVVCQYYYPEPFRINDICEELVKRGHEVSVLTSEPNYPEGKIYSGYKNHNHSDEMVNGVHVHRCRVIPRKTGVIFRFLNYYSFVLSSVLYVLFGCCKASDGSDFDIVFVNQLSPVMMAYPAIIYKHIYKVSVIMYCLDLWPISLVAGGIKEQSLIFKLFHHFSKVIYNEMDCTLVSSRMFSDYLVNEFNINEKSVYYLPQYAEDLFKPLSFKNSDTFDFVFAGNIGSFQSVITIIEAAKMLQDKTNIVFHIIGGGSELEDLKEKAMGLSNVVFYGRRPVEEMPKHYSMADALLVTLKRDPVLSLTIPGKVQSYMACGKPIIASIDGETAKVITEANCGFVGPAEDSLVLANNILRFIELDNRGQLGDNARLYYQKHFSKSSFFNDLEIYLNSAIQ